MLTVAMVQTGNYCGRGAEYVRNLHDGFAKHMPKGAEWRAVCLTDDPSCVPDGVEAKPVPSGLHRWWAKIFLFSPDTFTSGDWICYCDLDSIITGDLTDIVSWRGAFAALADPYNMRTKLCSSLMAWQAGTMDYIWQRFDGAGRPQFNPWGDQSFIDAMVPEWDRVQTLFPRQTASFKAHCRPLGGIPDDVRIVYFHGVPRPHECEEPYIRALWDQTSVGVQAQRAGTAATPVRSETADGVGTGEAA